MLYNFFVYFTRLNNKLERFLHPRLVFKIVGASLRSEKHLKKWPC